MRILSILLSFGLILLLFTTSTQLTSCTKDVIIRDTVTVKDTITIKDTVTIIDSSCASCFDLQAGLVAYYNFNGGTLNDSSGFNNHIVFNNATKTTDRFGKADNAYLFNGTASYMRVFHNSSLNLGTNLTLSAKVKPTGFYIGPCSVNNIFDKGSMDDVSGFYNLRIGNYDGPCSTPTDVNRERFSAGIETTGLHSDTFFVKANQWYDVTYTYDGLNSLLYVNGELKQKRTVSIVPSQNNNDLYIGKKEDPYGQFPYWFNGVIDDIRIYKRALCEAEVKLLNNLKK